MDMKEPAITMEKAFLGEEPFPLKEDIDRKKRNFAREWTPERKKGPREQELKEIP